jgi:hypothetical protein
MSRSGSERSARGTKSNHGEWELSEVLKVGVILYGPETLFNSPPSPCNIVLNRLVNATRFPALVNVADFKGLQTSPSLGEAQSLCADVLGPTTRSP